MYSPVQKGVEKSAKSVEYTELEPPNNLSKFVHRFWEIKTGANLADDFCFHVLPDACVHIVFNLTYPKTAGVTALRHTAEVLNLGKNFHFVGIRFLPGIWQGSHDEIIKGVVTAAYSGKLPLITTGSELAGLDFPAQVLVLSKLVKKLTNDNLIVRNVLTDKILTHIHDINTVADMAIIAGISSRHLQRTLKQVTGFSPHNLLKILRLQQSFVRHYLDFYSDQSHYIHAFRKITGYTPAEYTRKFDV